MKISVIGAGYVGLTTAACLAEIGHHVFCADSDEQKLAKLRKAEVPFYEPGLSPMMQKSFAEKRLEFGTTEEAIDRSEIIFICVGTPPLENGDADLSAIEAVARMIAKRASGYRLVIDKSTVPVQTGSQVRRILMLHSTNGLDYDVASNPEFLREGTAVNDFFHPDRIVVGVESTRAADLLREIYKPVLDKTFTCPVHEGCTKNTDAKFLVTDTNSAELIKHASNSFLAMKISYINMVANLCEVVGADISKVSEGMGLDPRIGRAFLNPGIGFGGFCFPKDLQAFVRMAEKSGCDFSLLREVEKINKLRIERFIEKIRKELWVIRGKRIGVWGLAFKPNTDDVRFAPSLVLLQALLSEGAIISAYDPEAAEKAQAVMPNINYAADAYEAVKGADALLIVTEWDEFRKIDWSKVSSLMESPLIVDGRNMFDPQEIGAKGFRYISIGREAVAPPRSAANAAANSSPSMRHDKQPQDSTV